MTLASATPASGNARLLEKLLAAVRPEFRADVFVPDPEDPVLGYKRCRVDGCDRPVHERGICTGHSVRWRRLDQPDLAEFLADPGPPLRGRNEPGGCTIVGCRYGVTARGLCAHHRDKWKRSGDPDPVAWARTVPAADPTGRQECGLPFCTLWAETEQNI